MADVSRHHEAAVLQLDGVAHEVVGRGRLRDGGQRGGLGDGEVVQVRDAEVGLGGGLHAVAVVAVEVLVEVGGQDGLLALATAVARR